MRARSPTSEAKQAFVCGCFDDRPHCPKASNPVPIDTTVVAFVLTPTPCHR